MNDRPKNLSLLDVIAQKDEEIRALQNEIEQRDAIYRELAEATAADARRVSGVLQDLGDDMGDACRFQRAILPVLPVVKGFQIESAYIPASVVSGDYYDVAVVHARERRTLRIFVADATSQGVTAALATMFLKSEYEAIKRTAESPFDALAVMNERLVRTYDNVQLRFSAVCMDVDVGTKVVSYACAGHPAPILMRPSSYEELGTGGTVMGSTRTPDFFTSFRLLDGGDRLIVGSDGAIVPVDGAGTALGAGGLVAILRARADGISLTRALEDSVRARTGGSIPDDLTVVTIALRAAGSSEH